MKLNYYKQIIEKYKELKKRDCIEELSALFTDVPLETLTSIIAQEYQRKVKRSYHYHVSPQKVSVYYKRYLKLTEDCGRKYGYLLKMADEIDLSPALLAKLILEHYHKSKLQLNNSEEKESTTRAKISDMLKNNSLIQDKHLAAEIKICILADQHYGPISDVIRNSIGQEYEIKLTEELKKFGFSFMDEKQLRERGYDKTPDIKLDIPIVVEGHIINWIESKASFGDEERHKEYLRDQYWSYCNRFGPGLVIYWCGYIEELNSYKEQGILISDRVPTKVTNMNPSILVKRTYIDKTL